MLRRPLAPSSFYQGVFRDGRQLGGGVGGRRAEFGSDDQDRQDSGLSPDLCDGIVRRVLLHLRQPDALVELL